MKHLKLFLALATAIVGGVGSAKAADGDTFYSSTIEGVSVLYSVSSEADGLVSVGHRAYNDGSYSYERAISKDYAGSVTIPSTVSRTIDGTTKVYTVKQILRQAFSDCSLTKVTLPKTISLIDSYAFSGCSSLNEVVSGICPNGQILNPNAFPFGPDDGVKLKVPLSQKPYYVTYYWTTYFNSNNIEEIPMPGNKFTDNGITYQVLTAPQGTMLGTVQVGIGGEYNQQAIDANTEGSVVIPQVVTYTSDITATYSFNVTKISQNAFNACNYITSFTLPSTIEEIDDYAMSQCYGLRTIYLSATTPPAVGEYAFSGAGTASNCVLVVPVGTQDAYQSHDTWNSLFKYIKEEGHESEWRVGDVFTVYIDYYPIPFRILSIGATNTVQLGRCLYSNTPVLGDANPPAVFIKSGNPTKFTVPETVEYDNTTYTVTAIGAYALSIFTEGDIELPSTITTIGYNAFNYSCWPNKFYCDSPTPPAFVGTNVPFQHYVDDETGEAYYPWSEDVTLYVPDGSTESYSSWGDYFNEIVASASPVTICGVGYSSDNPDLFNDGTASLTWETEESAGGIVAPVDPLNAPRRVRKNSNGEDTLVPVLTLNGATINYEGDGPAIEVNTNQHFYIRVKGQNTITASNAASVISVGTANGENSSNTSLIILGDEEEEMVVPTAPSAPRRRVKAAGGSEEEQPSLTIVNNTSLMGGGDELMAPRRKAKINSYGYGADGVYVYSGSFNVQNCDVSIEAPTYGLRFYIEEEQPSVVYAPRRQAKEKRVPRKIAAPNGPVDIAGYMNVYEDAQLKLIGEEAALWGANYYYFGEGVSVYDSDKSTYEEDYSSVDGPYFYGSSDNSMPYGTYVIWAYYEDSWYSFYAKYLKIGIDKSIFTENVNGVAMTFKITDEENKYVQTYGYWDDDNEYAVTAIPSDFSGHLTIPETVEHDGVTYTVTAIGDESFDAYNLPLNITGVEIPNTIIRIGYDAFNGCSGLTSVSIPESVTRIDRYAFCGSGLTSIVVPDNVTKLGWDVFDSCSSLTSATIGEGITSLQSWTFYGCTSLTEVTLPEGLTSLGNGEFYGCTSLMNVYLYSTSVPTHGDQVFYNLPEGATLHVPAGCRQTYVDAGWLYDSDSGTGYFYEIVEMEATSVPVSIGQYGMATFCSDKALNFTNVEGVKAYIVSGFNDQGSDSKLTLTRVYEAKAGEGLLLYGEEGTYDIPFIESSTSTYANLLVGCIVDTYIQPTRTITISEEGKDDQVKTYTNFVLSKQSGDDHLGFYRFTTSNPDGRKIEAGKAYLQLEGDYSTSGIKGFSIVFEDDEPTGIADMEGGIEKIEDAEIYNLAGQRLNKMQKGVNIIGGKKVLVK